MRRSEETKDGHSAQYIALEAMLAEKGIRMGLRCELGAVAGTIEHAIVLTLPALSAGSDDACVLYRYEPQKRGSFAITLDRVAELHQNMDWTSLTEESDGWPR